jgi:DNA-binding PadR family transcriptional regulator
MWDCCSYSAATLFGACVGDSIADRILEALQATENGLTREQIRTLFHGRVGSGSIDQALEKLRSLQLVTSRYVTGRGRPTTVWFAIDLA